jgi:hypothetical protein
MPPAASKVSAASKRGVFCTPTKCSPGSVTKKGSLCKDEGVVSLNGVMERAIGKIIFALREEPVKILPCLEIVEGGDLIPKPMVHEVENPDDKPFPKTYCKLYRIPKDYMKKFYLHRVCPALSIVLLNNLEKNTPGTIKNVFLQPTESTPTTAGLSFATRRKYSSRPSNACTKRRTRRWRTLLSAV